MNTTITFRIGDEDKILIANESKKLGLGMSSFCRYFILKKIKETLGRNKGENSQDD
jgi:hypothetical protein